MTADTAALQERIEAALIRATDDGADRTEEYAAAVLPVIREAQAEAWDECTDEFMQQGTVQVPDNPYLETGDRA